ncbi:hypothetical protein A3SI_09328 [Nitritalea halalkaliphila LW7]|uniref:Uncharacterized protein n=1 Tax=Nitritalea halalkaliphila LW7 TaxID=1189621 RepID=I5C4A3_9BACT|nr:hypothetical protein [Nitritalea halalkaliphila]EIM76655.1 hypothetical protein A3SI_09328 [Nitritalea halalkaliphila LW7]
MQHSIRFLFFFVPFFGYLSFCALAQVTEQVTEEELLRHKEVPDELREVVVETLRFFPELQEVFIRFEFKERIRGAKMLGQSQLGSLFVDRKDNRKYKVKLTRFLPDGDGLMPVEDVPKEVLMGWIGHELGHIMDYLNRSSVGMMRFGLKYMTSQRHMVDAELAADAYAIGCGLGEEILANKHYILSNPYFSEDYKEKIRDLYMSPTQIVHVKEALHHVQQRTEEEGD